MFGWEFPPHISGGLGVACEGLVRGLLQSGAAVTLVLPRYPYRKGTGKLRIIESLKDAPPPRPHPPPPPPLKVHRIPSRLRPYPEFRQTIVAPASESIPAERSAPPSPYGPNLATDVVRYAERAGTIARAERFDVIHAHDWMTYLAGLEARRVSGRPLVVHVHATEYDRAGDGGNSFVRDIERAGVQEADRVIAVSRYTADLLARRYGVPRRRIRVVHNAIDAGGRAPAPRTATAAPLVLFAGRVTRQKGPDYFIDAAARVARELPQVRFAVAGSGDRLQAIRQRAAALGLRNRIAFTGFLPGPELDRLYSEADVYVLPSVSEPFGLTALEALRQGTPVIVSRDAGVSEVVRHVLRVDFGDVDDLASKILSVLLFPPLRHALSARGRREVRRLSWRRSAQRCLSVYRELMEGLPAETEAREPPSPRPNPPGFASRA